MRAAFHNLGCKVNSYETDAMMEMLRSSGYEIVPFDAPADVYIVNTCTVTAVADKKSRQMLHRARRMNPDAVVVAVGCYVQTHTGELISDPNVDFIIGNNQKHRLAESLEAFLRTRRAPEALCADLSGPSAYEDLPEAPPSHTRAYIKIQDGCDQFCSYCIIPMARGRVRSREVSEILREIRDLAQGGVREFVLTGIHISSFGGDGNHWDGGPLASLCEEIAQIPGVARIRLGSLEPRILTADFVQRIAAIPQLCPHFHISLQSGCDGILAAMNRHYTTADLREGIRLLRESFDRPALTGDVIAGFPGETEEDHRGTCAFLAEMDFYELHVFPYSRREGTVAAAMPGQLSRAVKAERARELITLADQCALAYRVSFLGEETDLIIEEILTGRELMQRTQESGEVAGLAQAAAEDGAAAGEIRIAATDPDGIYAVGRTARYLLVAIPVSDEAAAASGQLVRVRLDALMNGTTAMLALGDLSRF